MDIKSYEEFISSIQSKKEEDIETVFWTELNESGLSLDDYLSNINESTFKRILGGLTGLAFGRLIGRILIKSLGLKPNGVLGKILSSRTVHIAIGAAFGKK